MKANSGKIKTKELNKKQTTKKGNKMIQKSNEVSNQENQTKKQKFPTINIVDKDSKRNRGYIFYKQEDIQSIYQKSGKLADETEFQVHYWFLNYRYRALDNSILDIAVPVCYFNYEQFATSGHIDFELSDVGVLSDKIVPIANMKTNELIDSYKLKSKIEKVFGNNLQFEEVLVNLGTMHKHPGSSTHQSFSSTDLNKTVKTEKDALGIVYPFKTAEDDKPSFSAIIAVDNHLGKKANLAHCEYRIANGSIDKEIVYEKNRCIAYSIEKDNYPSTIESLFGKKPERRTFAKYSNTESQTNNIDDALEKIFSELYSSWSASTDAVLEQNLKKKVLEKKQTIGFNNYPYNTDGVVHHRGLFNDEFEDQWTDYFKSESFSNREYTLQSNNKELKIDSEKEKETKIKDFYHALDQLDFYKNKNALFYIEKYVFNINKTEDDILGKVDPNNLRIIVNNYNDILKMYFRGQLQPTQLEEPDDYIYLENGIETVLEADVQQFLVENNLNAINILDELKEHIALCDEYQKNNNFVSSRFIEFKKVFKKAIEWKQN